MLKEYIAQKEWIVPPRPAVKIVCDMIEFCAREMPRWNPVSISGYHIREAGATAVAGAGLHPRRRPRLRAGLRRARPRRRRLRPAALLLLGRAQRLLRGDRQVPGRPPHLGPRPARALRRPEAASRCCSAPTPRRPASRSPRSSPTTTWCAPPCRRWRRCWAAPSRSTPTPSTRPTRCPPRRRSRWRCAPSRSSPTSRAADRVVDPLGGQLLRRVPHRRAWSSGPSPTSARIDELGGMLRAVEEGYPQREIAESAYRWQREVESGERMVVGVNALSGPSATSRHPHPEGRRGAWRAARWSGSAA